VYIMVFITAGLHDIFIKLLCFDALQMIMSTASLCHMLMILSQHQQLFTTVMISKWRSCS